MGAAQTACNPHNGKMFCFLKLVSGPVDGQAGWTGLTRGFLVAHV